MHGWALQQSALEAHAFLARDYTPDARADLSVRPGVAIARAAASCSWPAGSRAVNERSRPRYSRSRPNGSRAIALTRATGATRARSWAAWMIAAIRIPLGMPVLMPTARVEWLDADREHPIGQRFLYTGALNLDLTDKVRLLLDVSRTEVQTGSFPLSNAPVLFDRRATVLVGQVQVKI